MSYRKRSPRFSNSDEFHKSSRSHKDRDYSFRRRASIDRRYPPARRGRDRQIYRTGNTITASRRYRDRSISLEPKERYHTPSPIGSPQLSDEDRLSHLSGKGLFSLHRRSSDRLWRSISRNSNGSIRRDSQSPVDLARRNLGTITIRNRSFSPLRSRSRSFDRNRRRHNRSRHSRRSNSPKYKHRDNSRTRSSFGSKLRRSRSRSFNRSEYSGHHNTSVKSLSPYSKRRRYEKEDSPRSTERLSSIQRQIQYELKRKEMLEKQVRSHDRKRSESSIERLLNECKKSVELKTDTEKDNQNTEDVSEVAGVNSPVHRVRKFKGLSQITIERGKSLEKSLSPIPSAKDDFNPSMDLSDTVKIMSDVDEVNDKVNNLPLTHSNPPQIECKLEPDKSVEKMLVSPENTKKDLPQKQSPSNIHFENDHSPDKPTNILELSPISQAGSFDKGSPERLVLSPISLQDDFEQVDLIERQEIEARNKANLSPFSQEGSFKDLEVDEKVTLSPISQAESFDRHCFKNAQEIKNPLIERPDSADSMQKFLAELERSCERSGSSSERELSPIGTHRNRISPTHHVQRMHSPSIRSNYVTERDLRYKNNTVDRYDDSFNEKFKRSQRYTNYEISDNRYKLRHQDSQVDRAVESHLLCSHDDSNRYHKIRSTDYDWKKQIKDSLFPSEDHNSSNSRCEKTSLFGYDRFGKPIEGCIPRLFKSLDNDLFERREDLTCDKPSYKYSLQDTLTKPNVRSSPGYLTYASQVNNLSVPSYSNLQTRYSNTMDQSTMNPSSNLLSLNLPLPNNNPLLPEQLERIFKGFVIYFGVQKNSYLEKDPCVVIQESFSRSDTFGRLSVCFLDDESGPDELIKQKVCELRWRGLVLCRGQASTKNTAERIASINLINTLAHYCHTVQTKYQYYCGGDLPSFMIRDQEQPDVFKLVKKADIVSASSPQATSQYGINHKDVAAILHYVDNFFKHDTFCELLFGGSDLTEFTWQEMQKIIKHALDKPHLEYRMINGYNKGKYIAIGRSHTPQQICEYLKAHQGEHLRYRLLSPIQHGVNLLNIDGKLNPVATKVVKHVPVVGTPANLPSYGCNYNVSLGGMYNSPVPPMAQPILNYQQPNLQPMPYGHSNADGTAMYGPTPQPTQMLPLPSHPQPIVMPMPYGGNFNPNLVAMNAQPLAQMPVPMVLPQMGPAPMAQPQATQPKTKVLPPKPNRVLRSIEVIEISS